MKYILLCCLSVQLFSSSFLEVISKKEIRFEEESTTVYKFIKLKINSSKRRESFKEIAYSPYARASKSDKLVYHDQICLHLGHSIENTDFIVDGLINQIAYDNSRAVRLVFDENDELNQYEKISNMDIALLVRNHIACRD